MNALKFALTALLTLMCGVIALLVEVLVDRHRPDMGLFGRFVIMAGLALAIGGIAIGFAYGHDSGQWGHSDPAVREWYESLMQPDVPTASCCGEADAYWCDDYFARDGKAFCRVTDDRDDASRGRPHVDVGTEVEIPNNKLKWDRSNPTGHGVVFLSRGLYVYCYVQPGGV